MSPSSLSTLIREIAKEEGKLNAQSRRQPQDKGVNRLRTFRDKCQELLLHYPCAKESDGVEVRLWMQTSAPFISFYEQSFTALDQDPHSSDQSGPPVGERKRLLGRFKQLLAGEESFWEEFVIRLLCFIDITEAQKVLVNLELSGKFDQTSKANRPAQEHEARRRTLGRVIAFLGNAARYKEHYNESKGRSPAGSSQLARNTSGSPTFFRPRIYEKARRCYEQARKLIPDEGYPLHQLAILESLKNDTFNSTNHAYQALCSQRRDESAVDHLEKTLAKALDEWKRKVDDQADPAALDATSPTNAIYLRVDLFKDQVVVLHALWHAWSRKGIAGTNDMLPNHSGTVVKSFVHLVSENHIPGYMILDAIMLSQAAFWRHHHPCSATSESQLSFRPHNLKVSTTPDGFNTQIEWAILDHLLDLYRSLLEIGESEVQKLQETDNIGQHVSPTFERTLPALRIASKWLRANYSYLLADKEFEAIRIAEKHPVIKVPQAGSSKISYRSTKTIRFWNAYATFTETLSTAFPEKALPALDGALEEDENLNGFAPLQGFLRSTSSGSDQQAKVKDGGLKRISDLLVDAKALAQLEGSPLSLTEGHFSLRSDLIEDKTEELGEHIIRGVLGVLDDEDEDEETVPIADISALNAKKRRPSDSGSVEARKDARNTRRRMSPPLPTTPSERHFPSGLDIPDRYQLAWSGPHDRLLPPKEQHHGMTSRPTYSEHSYSAGRSVVIGAGLPLVPPRPSQDCQKVYPFLPQRPTHRASRS